MLTKFSPRFIIANKSCFHAAHVKALTFWPADGKSPISLEDILNSELALGHKFFWLIYHAVDSKELNQLLATVLHAWCIYCNPKDKTEYQKIAMMLWDNELDMTRHAIANFPCEGDFSSPDNFKIVQLMEYFAYIDTGNKPCLTAQVLIDKILEELHDTEGEIKMYKLIECIAWEQSIPTFMKILMEN